jgi:hypothetical protein
MLERISLNKRVIIWIDKRSEIGLFKVQVQSMLRSTIVLLVCENKWIGTNWSDHTQFLLFCEDQSI